MKVGIIGTGNVGKACASSMLPGPCTEIVLLDRKRKLARGVAADLAHAAVLFPPTRIYAGGYGDLAGASVVVITAGLNEQAGGATDRKDKLGRLRLLAPNARIYRRIVPEIRKVARDAIILVVTDPPDPLADVARGLARGMTVLSAGTFLDTIRFRAKVAESLGCNVASSSVNAMVLGEHGTSQVYVWSSATIGAELVLDIAKKQGHHPAAFKRRVQARVRSANIDIIDGTGASQHGIGFVTARIVEAIVRDEGLIAPIGVFHKEHDVTLSLPAVIDRNGVSKVLHPVLSPQETDALEASAQQIRDALAKLRGPARRRVANKKTSSKKVKRRRARR